MCCANWSLVSSNYPGQVFASVGCQGTVYFRGSLSNCVSTEVLFELDEALKPVSETRLLCLTRYNVDGLESENVAVLTINELGVVSVNVLYPGSRGGNVQFSSVCFDGVSFRRG